MLSPTVILAALALDPLPPANPAGPGTPVFSGSVGLQLTSGEEVAWLAGPSYRMTWMPLPFLGLTGDAYVATIAETFPWGWVAGARVGPVLRWPLGRGPISPFVAAQAGVLGVFAVGGGADGGKSGAGGHELSVEAGVDIPVKDLGTHRGRQSLMFLSVSGRAGTMTFDHFEAGFGSGRIALGVGF